MLTLEIFSDGERWQLRSPTFRCCYLLRYYLPECISVNYLIREYLVWFLKVAGVDTGNIFRWRTMAASFSKVYAVVYLLRYYLPECISVNYLIREYLVWFLKVSDVGTGNI